MLAFKKIYVPCSKCIPCMINRRREWVLRLVLEASCYDSCSFVTITYDDDHLPFELEVSHLQKFLKRVRKQIYPRKVRYFACGEYGTINRRPHYHLIFFGLDIVEAKFLTDKCWTFGFNYVGEATRESMQYVAGYCVKKLDDKVVFDEDTGLVKRKEFMTCSKRPYIASFALSKLLPYVHSQGNLDVISNIRIGDKHYVLPRILKNKLRELCYNEDELKRLKEARLFLQRFELKQKVADDFGFSTAYLNPNFSYYAHKSLEKETLGNTLKLERYAELTSKRKKL